MTFSKAIIGELSITPDHRKTLALFIKKPRDLPLRRSSGCMGGDISAVVPSASRRPRTFSVLSVGR